MDIYSDLKKFAGAIKVTKIIPTESEIIREQNELEQSLQNEQKEIESKITKIDKVTKVTKVDKKERTVKTTKGVKNTKYDESIDCVKINNAPVYTVDEIAAMVNEPMTPLKDANGYIHDFASMALKCQLGHIHKYFLNDIISNKIVCLTCSSGNRFTKSTRDIIESVFASPFILNDTKIEKDSNSIEFVNRIYKIAISCNRVNIKDSIAKYDDYLLIKISPTTSQKKIKDIIGELITQYLDIFPVEIQNNIKELNTKQKRITNFNNLSNFNKEPLPFTPELIKMNIAHTRINPEIANRRLNILENDKLYFDNC